MTLGELRKFINNFEAENDDLQIVSFDPENASRLLDFSIWGGDIIGMDDKNKPTVVSERDTRVLHVYFG
jgi:hypothetical protein